MRIQFGAYKHRRSDFMIKFVFSSLYNDPSEFLWPYIDNFLAYTSDDVALLINLGAGVKVPDTLRVPPRVQLIRAETPREKWGSTLLVGHIENFRYAEKVFPGFAWFITTASNALFLRAFNGGLAIEAARSRRLPPPPRTFESYWDALPSGWHWPRFARFDEAAARLRGHWGIEGLNPGQIEGHFASREDWGHVAAVSDDLREMWPGLDAPLEEILPPTVIDALGNGERTTVCHVHWHRAEGKNVLMGDLVDLDQLPPQVCAMKWFQRDTLTSETLAVTTQLGRELVNALRRSRDASARAQLQVLLNATQAELDRKSHFIRIGLPPIDTVSWKTFAQRQICSLDGTPLERSRFPQPYLFMEDTQAALGMSTRVKSDGHIYLGCRPSTGRSDEDVSLQGYVYVPLPAEKQHEAVYLCCSGTISRNFSSDLMRRCVFQHIRYEVIRPVAVRQYEADEDFTHFDLEFSIPPYDTQTFFGVPLFAGSEVKFHVSVLANEDGPYSDRLEASQPA